MQLGAFSVSLAVKDLDTSVAFYEKLGFKAMGGSGKYKIMVNAGVAIGLFEGMFEENILTFNPGWNQDTSESDSFTDVRDLERELKAQGVEVGRTNTADKEAGPAHIIIKDPDGNTIMLDQHR